MWVYIQLLRQLRLQRCESINFVVLIPRITIPLRVKIRVRVSLLDPDSALIQVIALGYIPVSELFKSAELLKTMPKLVNALLGDTLPPLNSFVVSSHCISSLLEIELFFDI